MFDLERSGNSWWKKCNWIIKINSTLYSWMLLLNIEIASFQYVKSSPSEYLDVSIGSKKNFDEYNWYCLSTSTT